MTWLRLIFDVFSSRITENIYSAAWFGRLKAFKTEWFVQINIIEYPGMFLLIAGINWIEMMRSEEQIFLLSHKFSIREIELYLCSLIE